MDTQCILHIVKDIRHLKIFETYINYLYQYKVIAVVYLLFRNYPKRGIYMDIILLTYSYFIATIFSKIMVSVVILFILT